MKVYWTYSCDFGHTWTIFREESTPENEKDTLCPEAGHSAVTLKKEKPLDQVVIIFRPAARVVDPVKNQKGFEDKYYLVFRNIEETEELVSEQLYSYSEAINSAQKFNKRSWEWTKEWWEKLAL